MGGYNIFDILGSVMIGPSSSHAADAHRIAKTVLMIAGNKFKKVEFDLHESFAKTYKGHGADRALLAGVLEIEPDSIRLRDSFAIAKQRGIDYVFREADLGDVHPNTARIAFTYENGITMYIIESSIGGGNVEIIDINGIAVQFTGSHPTILLKYMDVRGIIVNISSNLVRHGYNIEGMKTLKHSGVATLIVELDKNIGEDLTENLLKDKRFFFTKYIQRNQREFMFDTSLEIINTAKKDNRPFCEYVIEIENERADKSEEFIRNELSYMLDVMERSAADFLETPSVTNQHMIDGSAHKMHVYANEDELIVGNLSVETMVMAFSTLEISAAMGKIVASPTTGSAGILPAALMSFKQRYDCTHDELVDAVLVAIGVGQLLGKYATFSGADGGCRAETGSIATMAAGTMIFLRGGSIEQVFHGASFTILHVPGLVRDPIAGLVEYPYTLRNAMDATNAIISTDMALAGITSIVPFEEVCQVMRKIGKTLPPSLREIGMGGAAGTKTGQDIREKLLGSCNVGDNYED